MRGDVDPGRDHHTPVVPAALATAGAVGHMVDETERIHRLQLQEIAVHRRLIGHGHAAAEPVEVGVGAGLRNIGTVHQKHFVLVLYVIEKGGAAGLAAQDPADGEPGVALQSTCVATGWPSLVTTPVNLM